MKGESLACYTTVSLLYSVQATEQAPHHTVASFVFIPSFNAQSTLFRVHWQIYAILYSTIVSTAVGSDWLWQLGMLLSSGVLQFVRMLVRNQCDS